MLVLASFLRAGVALAAFGEKLAGAVRYKLDEVHEAIVC